VNGDAQRNRPRSVTVRTAHRAIDAFAVVASHRAAARTAPADPDVRVTGTIQNVPLGTGSSLPSESWHAAAMGCGLPAETKIITGDRVTEGVSTLVGAPCVLIGSVHNCAGIPPSLQAPWISVVLSASADVLRISCV
jgi:hypothetical protein